MFGKQVIALLAIVVATSNSFEDGNFPRSTLEDDGCGIAPLAPSDYSDTKIVGGSFAPAHAFPWHVAIFSEDIYRCGGTIISDEWVLTAAHCLQGKHPSIHVVKVVAGAFDLSMEEESQVSMESTDYFVHEGFNEKHFHNDIALIRLPSALPFNDYIQPVCLPRGIDLPSGVWVTTTGWGKESDSSSSFVKYLREVSDLTISNSLCSSYYEQSFIKPTSICVSTTGGHGTCTGDSGGPMNFNVGGITEVRGIASFESSAGCEAENPSTFTRVNHYLEWIQTISNVTQEEVM